MNSHTNENISHPSQNEKKKNKCLTYNIDFVFVCCFFRGIPMQCTLTWCYFPSSQYIHENNSALIPTAWMDACDAVKLAKIRKSHVLQMTSICVPTEEMTKNLKKSSNQLNTARECRRNTM